MPRTAIKQSDKSAGVVVFFSILSGINADRKNKINVNEMEKKELIFFIRFRNEDAVAKVISTSFLTQSCTKRKSRSYGTGWKRINIQTFQFILSSRMASSTGTFVPFLNATTKASRKPNTRRDC